MLKYGVLLFLLLALPAAAQDTPALAQTALDSLNQQLGTALTLETVGEWNWSEEIFSDASLGCPQPDTMYAQVITRGYIFRFTHDGLTYDFRSTPDGATLFLCRSYPAPVETTPEAAAPESTPRPAATVSAAANPLPASAPVTAANAAQVVELGQLTVPFDHTALLSWSPGGDMMTIAGSDDDGSLWLLPLTGEETIPQRIVLGQPVTALALARSINNLIFMAAGGLNGGVIFVQTEPMGLDLIQMDTTEDAPSINSIAISPDLLVVATAVGSASGGAASDNAVYLWNTRTGGQLARLEHDLPVGAVAISPDGRLLATGDQLGTVRLWQLTTIVTGEALEVAAEVVQAYQVQTDLIRDLAFSPDSTKLAAGSLDGSAVIWTLNIGGAPMDAPAPLVLKSGTADAVLAVAFSPDGSVLATAGGDPNAALADNALRLWDVLSGSLSATLTGHTGTIGSLAFNPAGSLLASASDDGTVRLWGVPAAG